MSKLNESANAATFPWADATLWSQPQYYSTIRMADINGDGKAELLVRNAAGILAYGFDDASGQWQRMSTPVLPLPDQDGWDLPQYYSTIRVADINGDGKAELLVRGSRGMFTYSFDVAGNSWQQMAAAPIPLTDAAGWNAVQYFSTIVSADINGDGKAEVMARGAGGVRTFSFDETGNWEEIADPMPLFADAHGWNRPQYYLTIIAADIDGDGKAELLARGSGGVNAYRFDSAGRQWQPYSASPILWTDDGLWNQPQYYATILAADINGDGKAEVIGRSPAGIEAYSFERNINGWQLLGVIGNDNAWAGNRIEYYSGITAADIDGDGKAEVLARGADTMHIYQFEQVGQFRQMDAGWMGDVAFFDPMVPDSSYNMDVLYNLAKQLGIEYDYPKTVFGWATRAHAVQPYYSTIRAADINGDGRAEVVAIEPKGAVTFKARIHGSDISLILFKGSAPPPPPPNYALDLNGDRQYFSCGPYNVGTDDFTIEAWVSTREGGPIFSSTSTISPPPIEDENTEYLSLAVYPDGRIAFLLEDQLNKIVLTSTVTAVLDGEWHHVAAVRQGANATIFFDGDPLRTQQDPETRTPDAPVELSRLISFNIGSVYQSTFFRGLIDEARVWRRALQHDEIMDGMHHRLTGSESGLVGHWTFDKQNAADTSPTGNHGALAGQPAFVLSELDFAPQGQPYLVTQAKLMQDYRLDPGSGRLTEINGYRVVISARTADGYALPTELTIYSITPTVLYFAEGTQAPVNQESPYSISTSVNGEVSFVIEAEEESLYAPVLKVRADFMASEERLVISPDRHAHDTLASLTGPRLLGKDEDGNMLPDVAKGRRQAPLPEGTTPAQSQALAQTIQYVMSMAVGHDIQPERSQVQSRALPEDVPAPRPYVPRYQNVRQLTRAYDAQTDAIATHFLPADQLIERILVVENMPQAHWMWEHGTGTFKHLADDEVDQQLKGLSVQHLDDLAAKFDGKRKLSLTSDQLLDAATGELAKRGLSSIFKKVKHAAKVVVKTVEVEVEDVAEKAEKFVKTAVVTIVTEAGEAFDAALQTVEDAAEFVAATIEKVGAAVKDFIDYLKALFEWDDILKTQRVLAEYLKQLPAWTKDVITKIKDLTDATLDQWQATMDREFDEFIATFGDQLNVTAQNALPANAPPPDVQNNYVLSLFANNFARISDPASFSLSDKTLAQDLNDALSAGLQLGSPENLLAQAQVRVLSTDLLKLLSDPAQLLRTGMVEMLNILKGLMDIAWQVGRAVIDAILNFIERALDELYKLCTAEIDIPLLTPFYELITGGRPLTFFNFFALAAAIPLTVTYKATMRTDDPVFSDADYDFIRNTSWRDYHWLNAFVDAALGGETSPGALETRKSKPDTGTKILWAGAYLYAASTSVWGIMAMINDTPTGGAQPSKMSILKASVGEGMLSCLARIQVACEGVCWLLGSTAVLVVQAWEFSPALQFSIWLSQVIPLAVDFATLLKRNGTQVMSGTTNAAIIGVCGIALTVAYVTLAISEAESGASADEVLLPACLVNYPASIGMMGQLLKLDPETVEFVPLVDMSSYGLVVTGTTFLTTADIKAHA